ncbi:MAG: DNA translocase FtsK [Chloroflexi bacterium]|nr:DNA translocase FtsK [Chloroflexota bacterium]
MDKTALGYWLDGVRSRMAWVLSAHNVPFQFGATEVHYRYAVFCGAQGVGTRVEQVERLSENLAQAADVQAVVVGRRGSLVTISVPLPAEFCRRVNFPQSWPGQRSVTALLGRDSAGGWLLLNLASEQTPHVLIAGTTGCGKSALARTMAASLAWSSTLDDLRLALVDPTGCNYAELAALPHVLVSAGDAVEGVAVLRWGLEELQRRRASWTGREPHLVLFVDELADLAMESRDIVPILTRIIQLGRQFRVHLVGCTQKPMADVIGPLVKANFPVRVVGSVTSPTDANTAAGLSGSRAERLTGRGDMVLVQGGRFRRFQAAWLASEQMAALLEDIGGQGAGDGQKLLERYLETPTAPAAGAVTDEAIREAWATGGYRSRRELEKALFGYCGGQAANRVAKALAATTSHPSQIIPFPTLHDGET